MMRRIFCLAALTLPLGAAAQDPIGEAIKATLSAHSPLRALPELGRQKPDEVGAFDLERVQFLAQLDGPDVPERAHYVIDGTATVPLRTVVLQSTRWEAQTVVVDGAVVDFRHQGEQLQIFLQRQVEPGDVVQIAIAARLDTACDESVNCVTTPTLSFLADPQFLPLSADTDIRDRFELETQIETPSGRIVGAVGSRQAPQREGEAVVHTFTSEGTTFLPAMIWGDTLATVQLDGPVEVIAPGGTLATPIIAEAAADARDFLSVRFGPYPYSRLGIAPIPGSAGAAIGAMAQIMVPLSLWSASADDPGWRVLRHIIAHEVGHQWHYNHIGITRAADAWLSEGLAEYGAVAFAESQGNDDPRTRAYWGALLDVPQGMGHPLASAEAGLSPAVYPLVYQKGAIFMQMLARAFGDGFDERMLAYVEALGGQVTSTDDFRDHFLAGRPDLQPFMDQWLFRPGVPQLQVRTRPARSDGARTTVQLSQSEAPFVGDLTVIAQTVDGVRRTLDTRLEAAELDAGDRVLGLVIDPAQHTLVHVVPDPPADVNFNGVVDGMDFLDLKHAQGLRHPSLDWRHGLDITGDLRIDEADLSQLIERLGEGW